MNISGIADVIYVLLTANYIGRRYALSIAHLFIGVSCVSMAFIPKEYSNTILVLYLLATVFAGASKYIVLSFDPIWFDEGIFLFPCNF